MSLNSGVCVLNAVTRACMEIEVESCVRGHHVYSIIWNPVLGERLTCKRELDNVEDRYAVAICKDEDTVVGHVPRKISFQYLLEKAAQLKTLARKDSRKLSKT